MATWKIPLLLVGLSLLAVSATARPSKTIFFFTSASYYPFPTTATTHPSNPNPNPNPCRFLTFFFTTDPHLRDDFVPSRFRFNKPSVILGRKAIFFDRIREDDNQQIIDREEYGASSKRSSSTPIEVYSSITSSIRDRTKDIMQVMGAMLFGAGCGALTATAMYLIWSLFWPSTITFGFDDSDGDDDDNDNDVSSKKMGGYVILPTAKVVDDDLKKPLAKEVV